MTALPDPAEFSTSFSSTTPKTANLVRPNVVEHYWGYTISPNEQVVDVAVLLRGFAGLLTIGCFIGALGVWAPPAIAFAGEATMIKAMASILLTCIGAMLMSFVGRGTQVRVNVDTSAGEIHEVVDGLFGKDVVLTRYGIDAVEAVEVVVSAVDPAFGQVQISVRNGSKFAAGDGEVAALTGLRDRLACDFGLDHEASPREAIWSGPLAA